MLQLLSSTSVSSRSSCPICPTYIERTSLPYPHKWQLWSHWSFLMPGHTPETNTEPEPRTDAHQNKEWPREVWEELPVCPPAVWRGSWHWPGMQSVGWQALWTAGPLLHSPLPLRQQGCWNCGGGDHPLGKHYLAHLASFLLWALPWSSPVSGFSLPYCDCWSWCLRNCSWPGLALQQQVINVAEMVGLNS